MCRGYTDIWAAEVENLQEMGGGDQFSVPGITLLRNGGRFCRHLRCVC